MLPRSRAYAGGWEYQNPGFDNWRSRRESAVARRRELLKTNIKALFEANDST